MRPEDLLSALEPPALPPELRGATLAAAAAAMAAEPRPDPWTRVWRSPAWRLAWAACTALLLAAHLALSLGGPPARGPSASGPSGELTAFADLAPLRLDLEPASAVFAALAHRPETTGEESTS